MYQQRPDENNNARHLEEQEQHREKGRDVLLAVEIKEGDKSLNIIMPKHESRQLSSDVGKNQKKRHPPNTRAIADGFSDI